MVEEKPAEVVEDGEEEEEVDGEGDEEGQTDEDIVNNIIANVNAATGTVKVRNTHTHTLSLSLLFTTPPRTSPGASHARPRNGDGMNSERLKRAAVAVM